MLRTQVHIVFSAKLRLYRAPIHRPQEVERYFNYLDSPEGLRTLQSHRGIRRIHIDIAGVEPRAKHSMPESDKDEIQRQLLQQLSKRRRLAFRGPLVLRLDLATSHKTPSHSHNIAKNLLDLFATPRPALKTRRRSILYTDDRQIHGLVVRCRHGEADPAISIDARSLGDFCADLDLVDQYSDPHDDEDEREWRSFNGAELNLESMLDAEPILRSRFGDSEYEALLLIARQRVQEERLGHAALTPYDLARFYCANLIGYGSKSRLRWEEVFALSSFRIMLSEPPQAEGGSTLLKKEIDEKLADLQSRFRFVFEPLLAPVAVEVLIKPPPPRRQRAVHDLDNVLRTYLVPRVVDMFKPPSNYDFAFAPISTHDLSLPPLSTRFGLTRYEAWRLPPASDDERGFICLAIVHDPSGLDDVLGKVDTKVSRVVDDLYKR